MNEKYALKIIKKPRSACIVDHPINFGKLKNLHLELLEDQSKCKGLYFYLDKKDEYYIMSNIQELCIKNAQILKKSHYLFYNLRECMKRKNIDFDNCEFWKECMGIYNKCIIAKICFELKNSQIDTDIMQNFALLRSVLNLFFDIDSNFYITKIYISLFIQDYKIIK